MIKDNLDFNQSVKPNTEFLEQLLQKLPEFFTSSDSDKEAEFDMEKFQKALKEQNVEELSSGYQLDFIGKNYAKNNPGSGRQLLLFQIMNTMKKLRIKIARICFLLATI